MKNLHKAIILGMLLSASTIMTHAQQPYIDSVNVQVGKTMEINLKIYEYAGLNEIIVKDLKSLGAILLEKKEIPPQGTYSISYEPNTLLSIKPGGTGEKIIWDNGKVSRYPFDNQLSINADNYSLQIQFNDPAEIVSDDLIKRLSEVIDTTTAIKSRLTTTYHYSFQDGKMLHLSQLDNLSGQKDVMMLNGGVGVNLIRNQPVIDLSAELGLVLCKKGIWKNQYYLSYNSLSDFSDSSRINQNGFLNLGYRHNLSKTAGKPDWLGLEMGYLVNRNGELFKKNTFKLGFNWEIGKYLSVSPQLYLSGDMKEIFPAVRIGIGF
jgi:hypothetical protein